MWPVPPHRAPRSSDLCSPQSHEASAVCFTRASPPLLDFTARPFISVDRVRARAHTISRGKRKNSQLRQECQESETLTPGPRPQIWSDHVKSRGNGSALQHPRLPSHCDSKKKKQTQKTFQRTYWSNMEHKNAKFKE